ncbi:MAG: hypothetical protein HDR17_02470 [Lachnospiraceae bacterium]|nr:hypothetical protein [Lachnospiraceae bacterium]
MTTLEYNQIKEVFKPAKLVNKLQKINNDICDITNILFEVPFNMENARQKVISINTEHPENRLFFSLIYPPSGEVIPICIASSDNLKQDLDWKKSYLSVKATAKTLDEVVQQLKSLYNTNL